jgi:hypothetical protein
MPAHCHFKVRDAAKLIAGMVYDRLMANDLCYATWKQQNPGVTAKELERRFIERNWGMCLGSARQYLAAQLSNPNVPEAQKIEILDVLAKDNTLIRGRTRV